MMSRKTTQITEHDSQVGAVLNPNRSCARERTASVRVCVCVCEGGERARVRVCERESCIAQPAVPTKKQLRVTRAVALLRLLPPQGHASWGALLAAFAVCACRSAP